MHPSSLKESQRSPPTEREFRVQRLLDQTETPAYTCDPAGLITYFNPQAAALWGQAPILHDPELRYCGSYRLFATDGTPIPREQCWMAKALTEARSFNGNEVRIERPDGLFVSAMAFASPILTASGQVTGGINFLLDLSEDRRANAEIRCLQAEQDQRARNRITALLALIVEFQQLLVQTRSQLEVMPVCAWCKSVREPSGVWVTMENHFARCCDVRVSHGICPTCAERYQVETVGE